MLLLKGNWIVAGYFLDNVISFAYYDWYLIFALWLSHSSLPTSSPFP